MSKGFTLIELLIVIVVSIAVVGITIPAGLNFYNNQIFEETADNLLVILRKAHGQAVFQKNDSAFGVKFLSDSYVLFQGDSYAVRSAGEDEIFNFSSNISISGADEIIFSKLTGAPNTTCTLTITSNGKSQSININQYGKIEIQ
ncbi:MAG: prepilin-type N-terminal cleavage/methylation domain-containing protein [Patescibacteria group bacterium]